MKLGIWELDWKIVGYTIIVLACLLIVVNQSVGLIYKVQLLYSPCALCVQLNPDWEKCYRDITKPIPLGNQSDIYKLKINEIKNYNFTS